MNKTSQQHFRSCFELYSRTVYAVAFSMMKNSADANALEGLLIALAIDAEKRAVIGSHDDDI